MRMNRIIISLLLALIGAYNCSAQTNICKEKAVALNDIYSQEGYFRGKKKANKQILTKSNIKANKYFNFSNYLNLDSLNNAYINTSMYSVQVEFKSAPKTLFSILTKEDLQYMHKQFQNSDTIDIKCIEDSLDETVFFEEKKSYYETVSLPLFSLDKEKCIFIEYNNIEEQYIPNIYICKKAKKGWIIVASIEGSLYDINPSLFDKKRLVK